MNCRQLPALVLLLLAATASGADQPWVTYDGGDGPGKGKRVVLVSGDEEYRSEEALPQLGKILARRHGFTCTVLFAIDPATGLIDPTRNDNIPGLEALATANLMIIATRFRNLPDEQMKHVVEYVEAGKPVVGMRTATHAFQIPPGRTYSRYSWNTKEKDWEGGFGRLVLGETWINHHGQHGRQSTRGVLAPQDPASPITRGCEDIWGPTDVYTVRLPLAGANVLVLGQVLEGMTPSDKPLAGKKNDPMMPVAWTRNYQVPGGKAGQAFATTMGSSTDLASEGMRRLLVNAAYWGAGLKDQIPQKANVELVGEFKPSPFGFGKHQKGLKPADHAMPAAAPTPAPAPAPATAPAATQPPDPRQVIRVRTAKELLAAIGPNRIIELEPGKYNLTGLTRTLLPHVRWENTHEDQHEMILRKVNGLTLRSAGPQTPEILVDTPYTFVLGFEKSAGVEIENLRLGHSKEGYCLGGVIRLVDCRQVRISRCILYGCGIEGLELQGVKQFEFTRSVIEDCSYGILTARECEDLQFVDSEFRRNREFHGLDFTDCTRVAFVNCRVHGNSIGALDEPLFKTNLNDPTHRITFQGGEIRGNSAPRLANQAEMIILKDAKVADNSWQAAADVVALRGKKVERAEGGWVYHVPVGEATWPRIAKSVYDNHRQADFLAKANPTLPNTLVADTQVICPPNPARVQNELEVKP